jgi:hypothetical protein
MALYRCEVKAISRGTGRSCVAAAAYRAGVSLHDERQNLTHNYSFKADILHAEILFPSEAAEWVHDRSILWNKADASEKRKDARTAREVLVALPRELSTAKHVELIRGFVTEQFTMHSIVVDVTIHAPSARDGESQPHAHILVCERALSPEGKFAAKKHGTLENGAAIEAIRAAWGDHVNRALDRAQVAERVDHRSLTRQRTAAVERGDAIEAERLDRPPEPKIGPVAREMERRGFGVRAHALHDALEARVKRGYLNQLAVLKREAADLVQEIADQARQVALDLAVDQLATPSGALAPVEKWQMPQESHQKLRELGKAVSRGSSTPEEKPASPGPEKLGEMPLAIDPLNRTEGWAKERETAPDPQAEQLAAVKAVIDRLGVYRRNWDALMTIQSEGRRLTEEYARMEARATYAEKSFAEWGQRFKDVYRQPKISYARFQQEFAADPELALEVLTKQSEQFGELLGKKGWFGDKDQDRIFAEAGARVLAETGACVWQTHKAMLDENPARQAAAVAAKQAKAQEENIRHLVMDIDVKILEKLIVDTANGLSNVSYQKLSDSEKLLLKSCRDDEKKQRELEINRQIKRENGHGKSRDKGVS